MRFPWIRLVQLSQLNHISRDKAPKVHSPVDGVVDLPTPTFWNSRNSDTGNFLLEHTTVTDDNSMKNICMAVIWSFFPASSQCNSMWFARGFATPRLACIWCRLVERPHRRSCFSTCHDESLREALVQLHLPCQLEFGSMPSIPDALKRFLSKLGETICKLSLSSTLALHPSNTWSEPWATQQGRFYDLPVVPHKALPEVSKGKKYIWTRSKPCHTNWLWFVEPFPFNVHVPQYNIAWLQNTTPY